MKEFILELNWFSQILVIVTICGIAIALVAVILDILDEIKRKIKSQK